MMNARRLGKGFGLGGPWSKSGVLILDEAQQVVFKSAVSLRAGQQVISGGSIGLLKSTGNGVFVIDEEDVVLRGLRFECSSAGPVLVISASRVTVSDCVFNMDDCDGDAVYVSGGDNGMFVNNRFVGQQASGYSLNLDGGASNDWVIQGNIFESYRYNIAGAHVVGNIAGSVSAY